MNKPIDTRSPNAPKTEPVQAQKGGVADGNQPPDKSTQPQQKPGQPQSVDKDQKQPQKFAQGEAATAGQEPKQS